MYLDRTALGDNIGFGLAGSGVATTFCKVAFSSRKATLAAKKNGQVLLV